MSPTDTIPPAAPVPDDAALDALAEALGQALVGRGLRLAVAESCTGGWLAKTLTDIPGSSDWFDRGFVTYSDLAKIEVLGVDQLVLARHGAVSKAVVAAMAEGLVRYTDCRTAISVSGIAGPGGATESKPVGLVWFGFALGERQWTDSRQFPGDREAVRRLAVEFALSTLLETLAAD
jgi:nicotinamide-nucleotide amidase